MDMISTDWCQVGTKNYLIIVDHASDYLWAKQSFHKTTKVCLKFLKGLFSAVGFPKILQSDNTGKFRQSFTEGLCLLGVKHSSSSPFNPKSNSRAEMAVQRFKVDIKKNLPKRDLELQLSLLQLNQVFNTDKNTYSPFILFFKRRQNSQIPTLLPNQASHPYVHDCVHVHDSAPRIQCSIVYWVGPEKKVLLQSRHGSCPARQLLRRTNRVLAKMKIHLILDPPSFQQ